jgi:hypothetical protein
VDRGYRRRARRAGQLAAAIAATALAWAPAALGAGAPIMPLADVHPGLHCTAATVVSGTTISTFDVDVIDIVAAQAGQGPRILVRVSGRAVDASGIAQGFSGSPVTCPGSDGAPRVAGAISAGVGAYGNKLGLVTPIEQMLGEPVHPPASLRLAPAPASHPLDALTVSGLSPALQRALAAAGKRAGRTIVAGPSGAPLAFGPVDLVPGASVGGAFTVGDIALGEIGTVTYRDGNVVYAFGHPMEGAGRRSLFLTDAYVYGVIPNPTPDESSSYKLSAIGNVQGTLTADVPNAVIGVLGAPPPSVPITVWARDLDTGASQPLNLSAADETDIGMPDGGSATGLATPIAIAQAATTILDGAPGNESGQLCLRVSLRESPGRDLRFCNRYVVPGEAGGSAASLAGPMTTDAGRALALIDGESFAALHITSASATVDVQRGLAAGRLLSARALGAARPGGGVSVALRYQPYRAAPASEVFVMNVPRGVRKGLVRVKLTGPGAPHDDLLSALTELLGQGFGDISEPNSLSGLRHAFGAIARYDGLEASFPGMPHAVRAMRDPARVLTGSVTFALRVR